MNVLTYFFIKCVLSIFTAYARAALMCIW